jgi:hypothetical protein
MVRVWQALHCPSTRREAAAGWPIRHGGVLAGDKYIQRVSVEWGLVERHDELALARRR